MKRLLFLFVFIASSSTLRADRFESPLVINQEVVNGFILALTELNESISAFNSKQDDILETLMEIESHMNPMGAPLVIEEKPKKHVEISQE